MKMKSVSIHRESMVTGSMCGTEDMIRQHEIPTQVGL